MAAPATVAIHPYCVLLMGSSAAAGHQRRSIGITSGSQGNIRATLVDHVRNAQRTPGTAQRFTQQKFDLGVQAAEVVVRPPLHGVEYGRIRSQQEGLALGHGSIGRSYRR